MWCTVSTYRYRDVSDLCSKHACTKDSLPTDDPSSRTDAGHLRVAMLSEQLKSLGVSSYISQI